MFVRLNDLLKVPFIEYTSAGEFDCHKKTPLKAEHSLFEVNRGSPKPPRPRLTNEIQARNENEWNSWALGFTRLRFGLVCWLRN